MNIILVGRKHGHAQHLTLGKGALTAAALFLVLLLGGTGTAAYLLLKPYFIPGVAAMEAFDPAILSAWEHRLKSQRQELETLKQYSTEQVDALTLRLGEMQARLMRLDALGQRLTAVAKLDEGEFDFVSPPALGGPLEVQPGESNQMPSLHASLAQIEAQIEHRAQQLELLNELFANRQFEDERFITGRPITRGWLSSHFGHRTDPFTGRRAWHAGLDFAGKDGSDIVAVAGGIVTAAEEKSGYGMQVIINHGGGLVTRYAHCKKLLVKVGDIVQKGQTIALMGSTGRSTGPHVHFEVMKDGRHVNPLKYINRAGR